MDDKQQGEKGICKHLYISAGTEYIDLSAIALMLSTYLQSFPPDTNTFDPGYSVTVYNEIASVKSGDSQLVTVTVVASTLCVSL